METAVPFIVMPFAVIGWFTKGVVLPPSVRFCDFPMSTLTLSTLPFSTCRFRIFIPDRVSSVTDFFSVNP